MLFALKSSRTWNCTGILDSKKCLSHISEEPGILPRIISDTHFGSIFTLFFVEKKIVNDFIISVGSVLVFSFKTFFSTMAADD
jgi:hypothetical protein